MPSIVAFQLKQIFNQNLIFFRKWHFRFHVCPGSAETLARGGGLTNQHLIACSLSNISAKSYENRLMCIEVIVCYIIVVFLRHGVLHLALKTTQGWYFWHTLPRPQWVILSFGMRGVIADVITHAKFFVSWFRGFGFLIPQNFAISIGLAGRSYNSVSTAVLHFDFILTSSYYVLKFWPQDGSCAQPLILLEVKVVFSCTVFFRITLYQTIT